MSFGAEMVTGNNGSWTLADISKEGWIQIMDWVPEEELIARRQVISVDVNYTENISGKCQAGCR